MTGLHSPSQERAAYYGALGELSDYDIRHGGNHFYEKYGSSESNSPHTSEEYPQIKFKAYNSSGEKFTEMTLTVRHEFPFLEIKGKQTFLGRLEESLNECTSTYDAKAEIAKMTTLDEKGTLYILVDDADRSEENFGFKATLDEEKKYNVENIGKDVLGFIKRD